MEGTFEKFCLKSRNEWEAVIVIEAIKRR